MVFASLCDILESVADHQQLNRIAKYGNCCKVKDSHAGSQNGTQVCNACTALALVCRVARRANQRLMPLREQRQAATARNDSRRSSARIQKVTAAQNANTLSAAGAGSLQKPQHQAPRAPRRFLKPQETSSNMTAQTFKTDPFATLQHHGSEGRMAPAACSRSCPASLSEATRNYILQHDCPGSKTLLLVITSCPLLLVMS